jgi:ADP-heptose:LPS heptosyltransferase
VGKFSLEEFICLLNLGHIFITPDSGPMHLALLSNIKIIALFNFIKPEWRIPQQLLFNKVFPVYIFPHYFSQELKISSCWTEKDHIKVKNLFYFPLKEKINTNPHPILEEILKYLG